MAYLWDDLTTVGVLEMKMSSGWIYRAWYYFRLGYATYFSFLLGYISTLVSVYYLAIKNMPVLMSVFPHFWGFTLLGTAIGVPLAVLIGWLHMKRTSVYTAEADIGAEANPYYYKLPPGYWKEVLMPLYLELLRQNRRILALNNLLTPEEERTFSKLEKDLQTLISGGYVGHPRRRSM